MGALTGITVLDLTRIIAGPMCTQTLGDYGADVIKVEKPGHGDDARVLGPPFLKSQDGSGHGDSLYFTCYNRNKRSVAIDIATPEGQAQVRALAARADILVENYKTGDLARYGLDYASIRELNPGIVYCSITGYGQDGPYAKRPGYDVMFQAESGFMSYTGKPDGEPGGGPQRAGVPIIDMCTAMHATGAILAALRHKDSTGVGQHIEVALFEVAIMLNAGMNLTWLVEGKVPQRFGNSYPYIAPYNAYATTDGFVFIGAGNNGQWRRLCDALGLTALRDDPRLTSNSERVKHRDEVDAAVAVAIGSLTLEECVTRLNAVNVPVGPVNTIDRVFADPHVQHRKVVVTLPHPVAGSLPTIANPARFSATPVQYRAPPLLGQHTDEVLGAVLSRTQGPQA